MKTYVSISDSLPSSEPQLKVRLGAEISTTGRWMDRRPTSVNTGMVAKYFDQQVGRR